MKPLKQILTSSNMVFCICPQLKLFVLLIQIRSSVSYPELSLYVVELLSVRHKVSRKFLRFHLIICISSVVALVGEVNHPNILSIGAKLN